MDIEITIWGDHRKVATKRFFLRSPQDNKVREVQQARKDDIDRAWLIADHYTRALELEHGHNPETYHTNVSEIVRLNRSR